MDPLWRTALWQQFGATIDMLENALRACSSTYWQEPLWSDHSDHPLPPEAAAFWYIAYHTLFQLDLYLTGTFEGFAPPAPFTLDELDPAGVLPERPYTRDELHTYLVHLRKKCQTTIVGLSDEKARQPVDFPWTRGKPVSFFELLLYTMRHVQEHTAQLNLFLGQNGISGDSDWVSRVKADEGGKWALIMGCAVPERGEFSKGGRIGEDGWGEGKHRGYSWKRSRDACLRFVEGSLPPIKDVAAMLAISHHRRSDRSL